LQYAAGNFESGKNNFQALLEEYAKEKEIPTHQIKDFIHKVGICNINILKHGGIIFNREVVNFDNLEQYLAYLKKYYAEKRARIRNQWIDNRLARKEYCESVPKTKKEIELCDKKDIAINVIEEYYDKKFFTEANLKKDMILIKERDYGGDKRIGICIKKEPYANQYTITIRDILGNCNIANEGSGWTMQLERGAKPFSITKRYNHLPTKDELIDDICIFDILEQQEPVGQIVKDTGVIQIYPTAREYYQSKELTQA
jgi:hypothetical protein